MADQPLLGLSAAIAFLLGCGVGAGFIIWAGRQYVLALRRRWKSALELIEQLDTDNGMRTRPARSVIGSRYSRPSPEKMAQMFAVMEKHRREAA